jgi:hypothetical protein
MGIRYLDRNRYQPVIVTFMQVSPRLTLFVAAGSM